MQVGYAALAVTGILSLAGEFDNCSFVLDLAAQFRWQYLCIQLVLIANFVLHKRLLVALLVAILAVVNMLHVGPLFAFNSREIEIASSLARLRVLQINTNARNLEFDQIMEYLGNCNPDVFLLLELNPQLTARIQKSLPAYRFSILRPMNNPSGIGLFSKIPLSDCRIIGFAGRPGLSCRLDVNSRSISLIGVHLTGPINHSGWVQQNRELDSIINECRHIPPPLILAGDFNSAPWTSQFQSLLSTLLLNDSRTGFGIQQTWPSDTPITKIPFTGRYQRIYLPFIHRALMLPIDHFLVSREVVTLTRSVGPNVGSDHYPVLIELAW